MEAVREWAVGLCAAAVVCTILQMLGPKEGMGRIFRILTVAFFICCLTSPLLKLKSLGELSLPRIESSGSSERLQDQVEAQLSRQIDLALKQVADDTLKNYGIAAAKITAQTDTSEDGGIYITRITLYLDKQNIQKAIAAKQVMEQRLGTDVYVEEWKE
ncbi:MAG: hypothetical protein HFJ80_05925 [Clostridiales bacterium]|nr:hypothetical protein [Clostridiales bacterium]